jgi:CSLREA domain-containing protein
MPSSPLFRLAVTGLMLCAATACGGGADSPTAPPPPPPPPPPPVTVTVSPSTGTVDAGGSVQLTAAVANATDDGVTWSASGGTVAGTGRSASWTAPFTGGTFTVTAASVADPSKRASATITVRAVAIAVTPDSAGVDAGETVAFTASVTNSVDAGVAWEASAGTIVGDSTSATLTWTAPVAAGSYTLTARSTADPGQAASATVTVAPIGVSVTPATSSVDAGGAVQLSATVANAADAGVTWSASGGTVSANGTSASWTAPFTGGTFTVTATSVADSTKRASATITVRTIDVSVSPSTAELDAGAQATFTASVANSADTGVTWSADGGTIVGDTASATITWRAPVGAGSYTLTARSTADPDQSAQATVGVAPVVVSVTGNTAPVPAGGTRAVRASVQGAVDSTVVWTASGGTIAGTGSDVTWQAPAEGGSYAITATSVLDPTASASLDLTVEAVAVTVTPARDSLFRGETAAFSAQVSGAAAGLDSVGWSASCGTVVADGANATFTAPGTAGDCVLTATSVLDDTRSASVTITVRPEFLVNAAGDADDGSCDFAGCSLREAITAANAAADADVIVFDVAAVTLTRSLPTITSPLTIRGGSGTGPGGIRAGAQQDGPGDLVIDAAAGTTEIRRIFRVTGTSLALADLTLTGGRDTVAGALLADSGATVMLERVAVTNNRSFGGPGGAVVVFGASAMTVEASTFEDNSADGDLVGIIDGGGAIAVGGASTFHMRGGLIRGNEARDDFGGGLLSGDDAIVTLEDVIVEENVASADAGGGVAHWDGGSLTIRGGVIRNNSADFVGGGLIAGADGTATADRVTLVMENVLVEGNSAGRQGGGLQLVRNVQGTLTRITVRENVLTDAPSPGSPTLGGGIFGGRSDDVTIEHSTIADNRIESSVTVNSDDGGAGITFSSGGETARLSLRNSTVSDNQSAVRGGGVFIAGASEASVVNSTISGNTAPAGAGVLLGGVTTIRSSTIVGNTATTQGGGLGVATADLVQVQNTLLSANLANGVASNCATVGAGAITSLGNNLSDDASCTSLTTPNDQQSTSAGIASALADNGGPTRTHALLAGSAAIGAANSTACLATDQRGVARDSACDIGAVEFVPPSDARARFLAGGRTGASTAARIGSARRARPAGTPRRWTPEAFRLRVTEGSGSRGAGSGR